MRQHHKKQQLFRTCISAWVAATIVATGAAVADPLPDGVVAYQSADHATALPPIQPLPNPNSFSDLQTESESGGVGAQLPIEFINEQAKETGTTTKFKALSNVIIRSRCHMNYCGWFRIDDARLLLESNGSSLFELKMQYWSSEYPNSDYSADRPETPTSTANIDIVCSKNNPSILEQDDKGDWVQTVFAPGSKEAIFGYSESALAVYWAACHATNVQDVYGATTLAIRLGYPSDISADGVEQKKISDPVDAIAVSRKQDVCDKMIPEDLKKSIRKKFPNVQLPHQSDYNATDLAIISQPGKIECPAVAVGMFYDRKIPDYVLLLRSNDNKKSSVIAASLDSSGWSFEVVTEIGMVGSLFVATAKAGKILRSFDLPEGAIPPKKCKKVSRTLSKCNILWTTHDGVEFGAIGSAASVYYFDGSNWAYVDFSD